MSRVLRSVLAALAILGAVVAAYVVLAPDRERDGVVVLEGRAEATAQGLAVGVIDHLGDRAVTSVAVSPDGHEVSVATDDPAVASVSVFVATSVEGPSRCGTDDGFTSVSCTLDGGTLLEVVRRSPDGLAPTFIGRANDDGRGDVLVEVHGDSDDPEVADLVRDLVEDDALGLYTTEDRNARGRDLAVVPMTTYETLEQID